MSAAISRDSSRERSSSKGSLASLAHLPMSSLSTTVKAKSTLQFKLKIVNPFCIVVVSNLLLRGKKMWVRTKLGGLTLTGSLHSLTCTSAAPPRPNL